jgi:hypothetical protein
LTPNLCNMSFTYTYRRLIAMGLPALLGWSFTYLATFVYQNYALGLFALLPLMLGGLSTMLFAYRNPTDRRSCRQIAWFSLLIYCVGLLVFAMEGLICLMMALPIGLPLVWIGHAIGYELVKSKVAGNPPAAMVLIVLSVPALMSFEYTNRDHAESLQSVITSIEIQASPQTVWERVIAFPQLEEPAEWLFKTGIAYPINATIEGSGVGAIRYCNFSTGSFVEPITVWDKPRLLKFDVADQPEPMEEASPYDLHPAHLHGFFVSKRGQFRLIALPNGHTRLEGTTWYYNRIQPNFYWCLWSDYIVHQIHQRVLNHIKAHSEVAATRQP